MKLYFITVTIVFILLACSSNSKNFGTPFSELKGETVDYLIETINHNKQEQPLLIEGEVTAVCKTKGCWLNLKSSKGEEIRVVFKDYSFFVPKNITGTEVLIKGYGKKEITTVEELKHFAVDNGQSEEEISQITAPLEEYVFTASGVKLLSKN